jgi:hypothetical protein
MVLPWEFLVRKILELGNIFIFFNFLFEENNVNIYTMVLKQEERNQNIRLNWLMNNLRLMFEKI